MSLRVVYDLMCNLFNSSALLSRCKVIVLEKLSPDSVFAILRRAAKGREFFVSNLPKHGKEYEATKSQNAIVNGLIDEGALKYLSGISDGDARMALNCLQVVN